MSAYRPIENFLFGRKLIFTGKKAPSVKSE